MALRTFHSNPALGGFSGESAFSLRAQGKNGDNSEEGEAFAQILKELVDNAVDACRVVSSQEDAKRSAQKKRVMVMIERVEDSSVSTGGEGARRTSEEILKVSVVDTGRGMESIQSCVDAFKTSKGQGEGSPQAPTEQAQTAGRYGVGLTLCLLHAQRLVPDSCATIKSATTGTTFWTKVVCVVDTKGDSVRCIREERSSKTYAEQSGTSVTLFLPGGSLARNAWPRLAEYFARFKLSLDLPCSLEVHAPLLASQTLTIRSPLDDRKEEPAASQNAERSPDGFQGDVLLQGLGSDKRHDTSKPAWEAGESDDDDEDIPEAARERNCLKKAVQRYLECSVDLANVARALVPIRTDEYAEYTDNGPKLEVSLVVHQGSPSDCTDGGGYADDEQQSKCSDDSSISKDTPSASLLLIRMVNRIPLLDSDEALACGLVKGVEKKKLWNPFGLEVALHRENAHPMKIPTFSVRDSAQVLPHLQRGNHDMFQEQSDEEDSDLDSEGDDLVGGRKRSSKHGLLPAAERLRHILIIVQIHATPSKLPLPTLSKGRLPTDNTAIDNALELGISNCLRQLQTTNPSLILGRLELRVADRDARCVPAVATALTSILFRSKDPDSELADTIKKWRVSEAVVESQSTLVAGLSGNVEDSASDSESLTAEEIEGLLEQRIRQSFDQNQKGPKKKKRQKRTDGDASDAGSAVSRQPRAGVYADLLLDQYWQFGNESQESPHHNESSAASAEEEEYDEWF